MKLRKLKDSDNAVVGIVAAFLIVGLVVSVLAVVQTQYVPQWMKEKEANHMNIVADQFAQLKYAMDIHSTSKEKNTPITSTITLGSKEMPYMLSTRAYGHLEILQGDFNITLDPRDELLDEVLYELGMIKYSSYNAYYINQEFIYQAGAVILKQDLGNITYIKPSFSVDFLENVTINFKIIDVATVGNKDKSEQGFGPAPIQTEFISTTNTYEVQNISNMSINTSYTNAWHQFLNNTLRKAYLNYNGYATNYSIEVNDEEGFVKVEFHDTVTVNFEVEVVKIGAQIAPGWVE